MGQVFVRRTNTLSKARGKYSSIDEYPTPKMGQVVVHRRVPSRNHEATFSKAWGEYSSTDEYPLQRTNTLSKTWDEYSSTHEYPLKNMGKYSSWRITFQEHAICGKQSSVDECYCFFSETWGEYALTYIRIGNFVRISVANCSRAAAYFLCIDENTTLPCLSCPVEKILGAHYMLTLVSPTSMYDNIMQRVTTVCWICVLLLILLLPLRRRPRRGIVEEMEGNTKNLCHVRLMHVYDYLLRTDKENESTGTKTTMYTSFFSKVFAWLQPTYSSATDENPLKNISGRIPSETCMDEYLLIIMGQVFVLWTKTLSRNMEQVFVLWTKTLSGTWGKYYE